jgi:hypothetical protein
VAEREEARSGEGDASDPSRRGRLGPNLCLMPTSAAVTIRSGGEPIVMDGPFAETKEQLLGFWIIDCASLEEAIQTARRFASHKQTGAIEIRPVADLRDRLWRRARPDRHQLLVLRCRAVSAMDDQSIPTRKLKGNRHVENGTHSGVHPRAGRLASAEVL